VGYFIGDIVGSPILYMLKHDINDKIVESALNMKGGGILKMKEAEKSVESEINMCIIDCL
jgi:hypothetical protein